MEKSPTKITNANGFMVYCGHNLYIHPLKSRRRLYSMHIETARTLLRNFYMSDLSDLQEILGDAQTMEYLEPPYDIEKTKHFLQDFCIGKNAAAAVVHKDSDKMIGYVLLHALTKDLYEIAWIFNRNYWGQGYGYEACSTLITYAFSTLGAHKICAETIDPIKSAGLMKKLGMHLEGIQKSQTKNNRGEWADLYLYGLLKDETNEGKPS